MSATATGALGAVRGFVHAHVGWLFSNLGMEQGRAYGKDLYDDRLVRLIDRAYLLWVALTLGIPFAIGYALGGTTAAGVEGLVWGGLVRIFAYQHATFSVNSICHMFGRQDYRSRDEARNNWLVALLVFGEGWHNNHHAFPASARHGLGRFQLDPLVVGHPRARAARARLERQDPRRDASSSGRRAPPPRRSATLSRARARSQARARGAAPEHPRGTHARSRAGLR